MARTRHSAHTRPQDLGTDGQERAAGDICRYHDLMTLPGSVARWIAFATLFVLTACGSTTPNGGGPGFDGGDGSNNFHDTGMLGRDVQSLKGGDTGVGQGTLKISPQNPTLTVTDSTMPPTQAFTTTLTIGGTAKTVTSDWTLSAFTIGSISSTGTFTPVGTIAGTATVTANYGTVTATTLVTVVVKISSQLGSVTLPDGTVITQDSSAITPADMTALQGVPAGGDSGTPTTILYPYDQTVFPLGLLAPVLQFTPGSVPPVDFKISLDTTGFHWDGFGHVGNPAALQAAIPQAVWDGALESAQPSPMNAVVVLSVVKAAAGVAYGPAQAHLIVAPGKLTGVIYYESYSTDTLPGDGGTDFGLWAVKPGQEQPPSHLQPGCVICHGVSASGNTLTNGTDDPTVGASTGVYRVEADGGYTHLATAPPNLPYAISGIDSRGLGWGTVSPNGEVILRGLNQFWGGTQLLAWATPSSPLLADGGLQPLTTVMAVNGGFNMFVPEFSVDGNHLVFVNATNTADAGFAIGAPSQSIGMLDITTVVTDGGSGSFGSVTLTNPRTLYDSTVQDAGALGTYTKVPTFLPDSKSIVFQETVSSAQSGYSQMLPDCLGACGGAPGTYVDGQLAMLEPNGAGYVRVPLTNANTASVPTWNYEPKPLPVQVGGYYWVVFASVRQDAYPLVTSPKKLWVTAISPGATPGTDASHPPFTLVNQAIVSPQQSQRAYWALAPCQGTNASCQTGNDCCNGSCLPQSPTNPQSPLVCRLPVGSGCVSLGSRCVAGQSQDCCGAAQGVQCIGTLNGYGTCDAPGAPP